MSRTKDDDIMDDDAGLIGKVTAGKIDKLDSVDCVEGVRYVTGFVPLADPLLAGVQGSMEEDKYLSRYRRKFGHDLTYLSYRNPGLRRKMEELRIRWRSRLGEAVVSSSGAIAGTAVAGGLATALALSGPVGWCVGIAGLLGGGLIADKAYCAVFPRQNQDMMPVLETIDSLQRRGQQISAAMVLDVLVSNTPDLQREKIIGDQLEAATGTRQFSAATGDSADQRKLSYLMLRTGRMDEARQYAALLNSGQMKAGDLLDINKYLLQRRQMALLTGQQLVGQQAIVAPSLPSPPLSRSPTL